MDMLVLLLSYTAAAVVSLGVIAAFSSSIDQMLFRLLPSELGPHWTRYVKFALFVAAFGGGMPTARFDRSPGSLPMPASDGLMTVMGSAVGSLMAASWLLLIIFGAALAAIAIGKGYAELRKNKLPHDDEPIRRREASEPRPVQKTPAHR